MSPSPIRLALVGCPNDAAVWSDVAMRLKDACFTVVVTGDATLGKSIAEATGATIVAESLEAALASYETEFDAVVVHSPLYASLQKAEATINAAKPSKNCFAIGRTLRFTPCSLEITDRLSSGKLGNPSLLRVHRWHSIDSATRPLLVDTLFADVDLAMVLFDARPSDVYAVGRGIDGVVDATPDYIQIHFGFPSKGMAILDFSAALPSGRGYESLSLIASRGAIYADDHHNTHLLFRGGEPTVMISDRSNRHIVLELQANVDAIKTQAQAPVSADDYRNVHQVIDAIGRSLDSGKVFHEERGAYV